MREFLPVLLKDFYKVGHKFQYPDDLEMIYSNMTARGSRLEGVDFSISAGWQYIVKEYLIRQFFENFFLLPRDEAVKGYKRVIDAALGPGTKVNHIGELHEVGWLPLHIKAIPEGLIVPLRVPSLTIRNTDKKFGWLTNMLESLISNVGWMCPISATTAFCYRRTFDGYAKKTGAPLDFVKWQGHDFSLRGMSGIEAACLSAFGHALCFTGSDTIPVIPFAEEYYGADCEKELIVGSVPATEHSVTSVGTREGELALKRRLITTVYPTGIVSIVWDTYDYFAGITDHLPILKEAIMAREGKVVIRPDSGDPVKIVCGDPEGATEAERKGTVQLLWEIFGGKVNEKGYKELDPHIGIIYGDSITRQRQEQILSKFVEMGFASSNIVLGIGSYTYQGVTRDSLGWAVKATYGITKSKGGAAIFKDPKTDSGLKKSAVGLLRVNREPVYEAVEGRLWPKEVSTRLVCKENCTWEEEAGGVLQTIFKDGVLHNETTLAEIRARIEAQL